MMDRNRKEGRTSSGNDDVLVHILSCMKTLDAVRTCVLSSRWKNIWKLIYKLEFCICNNQYGKNVSFIRRVFKLLQSKDIQTFRLSVEVDQRYYSKFVQYSRYIDMCATFAVRHNVDEFTLNIYDDHYECYVMPQCLLTCKSLTRLYLNFGNFGFDISDSLLFPRLKSLYIKIFIDDERDVRQLEKLFHGCLVLEDLTISSFSGYYYGADGITFDINLPALRTLCIDEERGCDAPECWMPNKFVVEAKKLEYFYVSEVKTFSYFELGSTPCLNKVSLDVKSIYLHNCFSRNEGNCRLEILSSIRNTRSLLLSACAARVLSFSFDGNMPMFPNLTNLELEVESYYGWKLLPHFLTSSPNLQVLILHRDCEKLFLFPCEIEDKNENIYMEPMEDDFVWFDLESVPTYLSSHVRKIQMENIRGEFHELEVIKYLLKHSKVLESFSVKINNIEETTKIQQLIRAFTKYSPVCEMNLDFTPF